MVMILLKKYSCSFIVGLVVEQGVFKRRLSKIYFKIK